MRPIWVLGLNTYKEVIRDRILYALILFALLLMGLSLALGQLTYAEQARISANFGLAAIHLCAVVLAIFVGSNLVYKEIEKKTILTILVRPITRVQFILGKSLGLTMLIVTMIAGLALVLSLVFWGLHLTIDVRFFIALLGLLCESLVLLGFTLVFSMFTNPLLVVCSVVGIFLIGHWQQSLDYFASKSQGGSIKPIAWVVSYVIPDLERVNWKNLVLNQHPLELHEKALAVGYCAAWFILCISISALLFKRKDVG